jgi:hypothetical protein
MIPETTLILLPSSFRQYDIDNTSPPPPPPPPPPQPANRIQKMMIALVPCNDDQGEGRGRGNGTVPGRLYIGRRNESARADRHVMRKKTGASTILKEIEENRDFELFSSSGHFSQSFWC